MPATQTLALSQEQRQLQMLAPQLRQSLKLLQAPLLELRTLVQQELQQNPTLEEKPPETASVEIEPGGEEMDDAKELNFKEEFEILSRLDDEWYNYFLQQHEYEPYDRGREKRRNFFLDSQVQQETLQDHLHRQLKLAALNEADRNIGELIIGSINDDGYLDQGLEDLAASADVDAVQMKDLLTIIQDFDPIGVGARDVKECLTMQLERLGQAHSLAAAIVHDHLDALGHKHYKEIAQALNISLEDVHQAAKVIATLEPRPGRAFDAATAAYITPDVLVKKTDAGYVVILNDDQLPQLRISKEYKTLMNNAATKPEVKTYIRDHIRSGVFLIKSIAQRQQTLYKVAMEIVRAQTEFLDAGIAQLKPLTMAEVAKKVGLHETTVCRCIANKYMKIPVGLFEMKYFFTPGLTTADGKTISNKTVQDMITSLVAEEDPAHPLSDQDIYEKLKGRGIHIARRTVAKYRLILKIPPSHLRKTG